jgi:hypothetical protein
VAGKDGTKLFDKYHSWVNIDFIMEKCLIGYLKTETEETGEATSKQRQKRQKRQETAAKKNTKSPRSCAPGVSSPLPMDLAILLLVTFLLHCARKGRIE